MSVSAAVPPALALAFLQQMRRCFNKTRYSVDEKKFDSLKTELLGGWVTNGQLCFDMTWLQHPTKSKVKMVSFFNLGIVYA
jgi:hypothetical protein